MGRKSLWLSVALVVMIVGTVLAALGTLTQHEPAFYTRSAMPRGKQREELSAHFENGLIRLIASIRNGGNNSAGDWGAGFSDTEINSYFEEDFLRSHMAEKLLPDGITEPRITFEKDRIRFGFRYGAGPWSSIISVDFRVWLAQGEPNVVVLELQGMHAGALPISAQSLLDSISVALSHYNVQVTWYRHKGNPTAALKFQTDQARPTAQLRQLDLKPAMLTVVGLSSAPLPDRVSPVH